MKYFLIKIVLYYDLFYFFILGAVAARDWGLPCVINLVRASQVLRTGKFMLKYIFYLSLFFFLLNITL